VVALIGLLGPLPDPGAEEACFPVMVIPT
jgi:hypothetical protein